MFGNSHAGDYFGKSGNSVFKEVGCVCSGLSLCCLLLVRDVLFYAYHY